MVFGKIVILGVFVAIAVDGVSGHNKYNYCDALSKSIDFFQGQRCGKESPNQDTKWKLDSGFLSGFLQNVDLSGGYFDAGGNMKFGFPMAFTTTMLSWSVIEFGDTMPSNDCDKAREAVRWGTDYLLKACSPLPHALYCQVGHPKDDQKSGTGMSTPPSVHMVTPLNPGSDFAGETAAALAAGSIVFQNCDANYSKMLLATAQKAFDFADKYRGSYSDSLSSAVCPLYRSQSGFQDELLWAAAWLYKATHNSSFLSYAKSLGIKGDCGLFNWDNKNAGASVLLAKELLVEKKEEASMFQQKAESFMCSVLPNSPSNSVKYTPGGLLQQKSESNMQYVTSQCFLLAAYSKCLETTKQNFKCGDKVVTSSDLTGLVKKQVDYILGDNPSGMSYMVGFGVKFPQRINQRVSSSSNFHLDFGFTKSFDFSKGFQFSKSGSLSSNLLMGAVVGGPDENDGFTDDSNSYVLSGPATCTNAPLVGTLAYLGANYKF